MTTPSPEPRQRPGELLVEVAGAVATVTFSNPGKRNALTSQMRADLPGLLDSLQADPDVRVVVLTGAGDKAFVSGADISEFGERRTSPAARPATTGPRPCSTVPETTWRSPSSP